VLVGILVVGCGSDDNGGGPDLIVISDFEGEWVITEYKATMAANPAVSLELISLGGAMTFEADEDGDFTGRTFVPPSFAGMNVELTAQGTMELLSQDSLLVSFVPEMPPFLTEMRGEFEMTGNTVTLYDENAEFDFDGDQQMDPAIFEGTMVLNDGSYPPVIFTEDFEGHWEATGYTVTSDANPAITLNTIDAGATFEFDVGSDGTALVDVFIPASLAGEDVTFTDLPAAFQLEYQDTMTIAFTPEVPPLLTNTRGYFTLDGNEYTLTDEDALFDFDGDEVPEPASAYIEIERTGGGK
jgi:hypothetical protein